MITKIQFEKTYNEFSPSKIEKFYFRFFSINAVRRYKWVSWLMIIILFIPILLTFILTLINGHPSWMQIPTLIYTGFITLIGIPWIFLWNIHIYRIYKIRKRLNLSLKEYHNIVRKLYFQHNPDIIDIKDFIKSKCKQ